MKCTLSRRSTRHLLSSQELRFSQNSTPTAAFGKSLLRNRRLLTTFITPFGRFHFNELPFGISSAPEHFQKRMSAILSGLDGFVCQMDDVLVFGKDQEEHDSRIRAVLKRIESAGATLNPEKCEFSRTELKFLGHIIDIRADPDKTSAIRLMKPPENVPEL